MVTDDRHNLVTINHVTKLIYCKKPIGISVKSQTNLCLFIYNTCHQLFHMGRATVSIDVRSIRHIMNRYYITAQFLQCLYGSVIRSSLRTVYHDLHSGQIHLYGLNGMIDIFFTCISTILDLSDIRTNRELDRTHIVPDNGFDLILQGLRKLISVSVKEFNSIKLHRIVGCGNNNTCIYLIFSGQIGYRRCGNHAYIHSVRANRTNTSHQCICQHISRNSRIASNHNRWSMLIFFRKNIGSCLTQLHSKQRC